MSDFYTYAYLDGNGTPYYIGKGRGSRAWKNHGRVPVPARQNILLLKTGLTEDQAFSHEKYMINVLGRVDDGTGFLLNKTAGGQGPSGKVWSDQEKENVRLEKTGSRWWNNGRRNTQCKRCPGPEWREGRLISWDEQERIAKMKESASSQVYKLIHESGIVVYVKNLRDLGIACGYEQAFYRVMTGYRQSYKGWVAVEKTEDSDAVINADMVMNLCKRYDEKKYKIIHKDGSVMVSSNLFDLGKKFGTKDGFYRVYLGLRKSYKGWIKVELLQQG
jgi:hypothetical protein